MSAAFSLERVRRQEDLLGKPARQPRPVAVVAVARPLVPRLSTVDRREQRVVGQVDAGVVDASAGVLCEVRIAEPCKGRVLRTDRPQVAVAVPIRAAVGRRPGIDLVAVVGDECEGPPRRARDPVAVEVRRALVRRVDEPPVQVVREDLRLAAGELLVDVHGRRERRRRRTGRARAGQRAGERRETEYHAAEPRLPPPQRQCLGGQEIPSFRSDTIRRGGTPWSENQASGYRRIPCTASDAPTASEKAPASRSAAWRSCARIRSHTRAVSSSPAWRATRFSCS